VCWRVRGNDSCGRAENLIKLHKAQLASDRTSCRSPLANQMRLTLHTAEYWLILTVRDTIPKAHALANAEFTTIRLRLLKIGVRVIEMAACVLLAFAAAWSDRQLQDQRRVVGEPGDPRLVGIVNAAGASGWNGSRKAGLPSIPSTLTSP
jgi:hypothetical protein